MRSLSTKLKWWIFKKTYLLLPTTKFGTQMSCFLADKLNFSRHLFSYYGKISVKGFMNSFFIWNHSVLHQSIPAAPSSPPPLPGLLRVICPPCQSRGWGICKFCAARGPGICQPRGQPRAFDTHTVSYQNITTQRILLEKQADWLICQGQEKNVEVCKGMFLILWMHFFIAYQARIT